jgi:magnesium transporter
MLNTYQPPLNEFDKRIEEFENTIFLKNDAKISMEDLYYLKMQTRITKKLLIIFQNVMDQLEVGRKNKSALQDFKDRLLQLVLKYDEVLENANNLLNSYYVGFTTQNAYKYLKNHHKMKDIVSIINNGFSIQIYTKYNEREI